MYTIKKSVQTKFDRISKIWNVFSGFFFFLVLCVSLQVCGHMQIHVDACGAQLLSTPYMEAWSLLEPGAHHLHSAQQYSIMGVPHRRQSWPQAVSIP